MRDDATDDDPADDWSQPSAASSAEPPLRTRAGLAWVAVCVAALIAVALLVFLAQNTQTVHVSFLWLDGDTSLAVAALVSAVAGAVVTLVFGTVRIVQLRRAVKQRP
jgi:uncharacterized integral membrane protein